MGILTFIVFILLCVALILSSVQGGKYAFASRIVRIYVVITGLFFFTYWFFQKTVSELLDTPLSVQIINRLPQKLDFYTINVMENEESKTEHLGIIRPDHYRIQEFDVKNSNEFWIIGYLGKKDMVYFSQHAVLNKNEDQVVEITNYINQSHQLSGIADTKIKNLKFENIKSAIFITLDALLLFLNIILLLRRRKLSKKFFSV